MTNQNDFVIDNGTGLAVRTDIQDALQALAGNSSGNSEPSVKYAYQWWADSNAGILKLRNSANDAWIDMLNLDGTFVFDLEDGTEGAPSLRFADNQDTGIFSSGTNEIGFSCSGATRMVVTTAKGILMGNGTTQEGEAQADDLTIGTSTNTGITIRSGTTNTGNLFFSDGLSGNAEFAGYIQYDHNTNRLILGANENANTAILTNDGLSVGGATDMGSASNSGANLCIGLASPAQAGLTLRSASSTNGSIFFSQGTSGTSEYRGYIQYQHNNDQLYFGTQTANRMMIEDAANNGDIHISTGDIVFDTAGRGIDFSAAGGSAGGSASAILDDYEEGTYTPVLNGGGSGISYTIQTGNYVKIGRLVEFNFYIQVNGGVSNGSRFDFNLPFTNTLINNSTGAGHGLLTYNDANDKNHSGAIQLFISAQNAESYYGSANFAATSGSAQSNKYFIGGGFFYA